MYTTFLREFVINIDSYADFCYALQSLTNQEKGDFQELFVKCYFEAHSALYNLKKYYARVLDEIPPIDCVNKKDVGVDGYIIHKDNTVSLVQVKYRSNNYTTLSRDMIANMVLEAGPLQDRMRNIYLVSNTDTTPVNVSELENESYHIKYILSAVLYQSDVWSTIKTYARHILSKKPIINRLPDLRQWQHEAIDHIGYKVDNNFRLKTIVAPCGAGKTRLLYEVSKAYRRILILVPTLHLLSQTFTFFGKYSPKKWSYLLVGSDIDDQDKVPFDITTDIDLIADKVSNDDICVISTYQSLDKIDSHFDIVICDEAHVCCSLKDSNFTLPITDDFPADNKLFLTATPKIYTNEIYYDYSMNNAEKFGEMYTYSFKKAIDDGIINDYNIVIGHANVPIESEFEDSSFNALFIRRAVEEYDINSLLVFSNSHHDSKILYDKVLALDIPDYQLILMRPGSNSNDKSRIVRLIESGEKLIIFNVRVFTLGSDLPKLEGVMLCGGKSSKIDIVQSISRCLRKIDGKDTSTILVPCLVHGEDYNTDGNFDDLRKLLVSIGTVDETIFAEVHGVGSSEGSSDGRRKRINYMDLSVDVEKESEVIELTDADFELKIYNKIGSSFAIDNRIIKWRLKLAEVIEFVEANGRRPSKGRVSKEELSLRHWVDNQNNYILDGNYKGLMKNEVIRGEWLDVLEKYPFLHAEDKYIKWYRKLNECITFIVDNGKRPIRKSDSRIEARLAGWINNQFKNYDTHNYLMVDDEIRRLWEDAIAKYPLFHKKDNVKKWKENLAMAIEYVTNNNELPPTKSDLYKWLLVQNGNYRTGRANNIFTDDSIKSLWSDAIRDYPLLTTKTRFTLWSENLDKAISFVKEHNRRPRAKSEDKEEASISNWIKRQNEMYRDEKMDDKVRTIWEGIILLYPLLLPVNKNKQWYDKLEEVVDFIHQHNRVPNPRNREDGTIGGWVVRQRSDYKKIINLMTDGEIRLAWETAIRENTKLDPNFRHVPIDADLDTINFNDKTSKRKLNTKSIDELRELAESMGKEDAYSYGNRTRDGKTRQAIIDWIYDNQTPDMEFNAKQMVEESKEESKQPMELDIVIKKKTKIVIKRRCQN